ncbi:ER degradation-enhancing alpha-mannosidase-like protein 1, partial [Quaeritorhiza haematococci]
MGEVDEFHQAVRLVTSTIHFDLDSRVQVFEVTIRILGSLLSAHLLCVDQNLGFYMKDYDGGLLRLATDLANRLLPAFEGSATGIPYPRVNLRHGVVPWEVNSTCTAGGGTLVLEFGVLSRLTGDDTYERLAKKALFQLWDMRSSLGLVGNTLDMQTGKWIHSTAGIGAGVDSFYEYLLKAYILFGDPEYLTAFEEAYAAVMRHIRDPRGYIYKTVNMETGGLVATWVDSLSAFWPGLQVLAGDVENAIKLHQFYFTIWRRFHALPERFDFYQQGVNIPNYPLRPELIESTYMLYQATKNPYYLEVGATILNDLETYTRVRCGFASVQDVSAMRLEDRMESFFLSETLKYLYLLFDTEGHVLPLPYKYLKQKEEPKPRAVLQKLKERILTSIFGSESKKAATPTEAATNEDPHYCPLSERYVSQPNNRGSLGAPAFITPLPVALHGLPVNVSTTIAQAIAITSSMLKDSGHPVLPLPLEEIRDINRIVGLPESDDPFFQDVVLPAASDAVRGAAAAASARLGSRLDPLLPSLSSSHTGTTAYHQAARSLCGTSPGGDGTSGSSSSSTSSMLDGVDDEYSQQPARKLFEVKYDIAFDLTLVQVLLAMLLIRAALMTTSGNGGADARGGASGLIASHLAGSTLLLTEESGPITPTSSDIDFGLGYRIVKFNAERLGEGHVLKVPWEGVSFLFNKNKGAEGEDVAEGEGEEEGEEGEEEGGGEDERPIGMSGWGEEEDKKKVVMEVKVGVEVGGEGEGTHTSGVKEMFVASVAKFGGVLYVDDPPFIDAEVVVIFNDNYTVPFTSASTSESAQQSPPSITDLSDGCTSYPSTMLPHILNRFILVRRGSCLFYEKAYWAEQAGAKGLM